MTPEEREKQIKELYSIIGKITIKNEHMNKSLFTCSLFILQASGLDQEFGNTVLAGQNVETMRRTFTSLAKKYYQEDSKDIEIVEEISKIVDSVNSKRNNLIHHVWYIGWGNEYTEDYSIADGHALRKDYKKGGFKLSKQNTTEFYELDKRMDHAIALVQRLVGCIVGFKPSKNFYRDSNGVLQPGKADMEKKA